MRRDNAFRTEGSLIVFTGILLALAVLLVLLARTRTGVPSDAVNLNTASRDTLALALELHPTVADSVVAWRVRRGGFASLREALAVPAIPPNGLDKATDAVVKGRIDVNRLDALGLRRTLDVAMPVAQRLSEYRAGLRGGTFARPRDVLAVPAMDPSALNALGARAIVRTPGSVFWRFLGAGLLMLALVFVVPVLLRQVGVAGDPFLVPLTYLLAGLGMVMMFSIPDPLRDRPAYGHHLGGIAAGSVALWLGATLSLTRRRSLRHYTYIWALAAFALLVGLALFGVGPQGVRLSLGFFQPVEVIKLLLVLFVAAYLAQRADLIADAMRPWRAPQARPPSRPRLPIALPRWSDAGPLVAMFAVAIFLLLVVRDMGPALLLFGAFALTFYLATGRAEVLWTALVLSVAGMALGYALRVGVLPVRIGMWLSPWQNPHAHGLQLAQSLWAISSGGWFGSGLGLGAPAAMAAVKNDLVFAAVAEELGWPGTMLVLGAFTVLVWRGVRVGVRTENDFDRVLAYGLSALFACQVFLITAGVTGLLPLTGITLPFVAYGNSSLLASMFAVGLLRGVSSPVGSVPVGVPRPRLQRAASRFALATAVALLGLVGVARVFWLQTVAADRVAGRTATTPDADRVVRAKLNPRLLALERSIERGSIYDRRGKVLATSRLSEIARSMPEDPARARRLFRARQRWYPRGSYTAHVVGYADPALGGPTGIESEFNADLRGFAEYSDLVRDYRRKDLPGSRTRRGLDVVLTLDADLQEEAHGILKRSAARVLDRRGRPRDRGAMVALEPATGEVLVAVTLPTYNPNTITARRWRELLANADLSSRLVDRSRMGLYPPGSTIKVLTMGAALEEAVEPPYDCDHYAYNVRWTYGKKTYARKRLADDVHDEPHNLTRLDRALRVSCNLYFANLGIALGADRLHRALAGGDRWSLAYVQAIGKFAEDLPDNAYGQGSMVVTPAEMARCVAAVANKGVMLRPTLWREVRQPGSATVVRSRTPSVVGRPLGEANAARLAEAMRSVVSRGTARGVFDDLPVQVAGKTGTAETETGDGSPHSWFVGYAPYSRPELAFACIIEHGGYGRRVSAPACAELLSAVYGR